MSNKILNFLVRIDPALAALAIICLTILFIGTK